MGLLCAQGGRNGLTLSCEPSNCLDCMLSSAGEVLKFKQCATGPREFKF